MAYATVQEGGGHVLALCELCMFHPQSSNVRPAEAMAQSIRNGECV